MRRSIAALVVLCTVFGAVSCGGKVSGGGQEKMVDVQFKNKTDARQYVMSLDWGGVDPVVMVLGPGLGKTMMQQVPSNERDLHLVVTHDLESNVGVRISYELGVDPADVSSLRFICTSTGTWDLIVVTVGGEEVEQASAVTDKAVDLSL